MEQTTRTKESIFRKGDWDTNVQARESLKNTAIIFQLLMNMYSAYLVSMQIRQKLKEKLCVLWKHCKLGQFSYKIVV